MIRYISFSRVVFALAMLAATIGCIAIFEEFTGHKVFELRNTVNVQQSNRSEQEKSEFDRHFLQLEPLDFHF